jgi:hypothetical protein
MTRNEIIKLLIVLAVCIPLAVVLSLRLPEPTADDEGSADFSALENDRIRYAANIHGPEGLITTGMLVIHGMGDDGREHRYEWSYETSPEGDGMWLSPIGMKRGEYDVYWTPAGADSAVYMGRRAWR